MWKGVFTEMDLLSSRDLPPRRANNWGRFATILVGLMTAVYAISSTVSLFTVTDVEITIEERLVDEVSPVEITCTCSHGCFIALEIGDCIWDANSEWLAANPYGSNVSSVSGKYLTQNVTGYNHRTAGRWVAAGSVHNMYICPQTVGSNALFILGGAIFVIDYNTNIDWVIYGTCPQEDLTDSLEIATIAVSYTNEKPTEDTKRVSLGNAHLYTMEIILDETIAKDTDGEIVSTTIHTALGTTARCMNIADDLDQGLLKSSLTTLKCASIATRRTVVVESEFFKYDGWTITSNIGGMANVLYTIGWAAMAIYGKMKYSSQWEKTGGLRQRMSTLEHVEVQELGMSPGPLSTGLAAPIPELDDPLPPPPPDDLDQLPPAGPR